MASRIPDFHGFPDPIENFTMIPNEFFDLLKYLKGAEIKLNLHIFRETVGWQRRFYCIRISQFVEELGMSKKTVMDNLRTLEHECECILRYQEGKGSQRKTFFFLNTPANFQIVQALKNGHMDIEQAEAINTLNSHSHKEFKPSVDNPKREPSKGANSSPTCGKLGPDFEPSRKKTRVQKERLKKLLSVLKTPKSVLVGTLKEHFSQASAILGKWEKLAQKLRKQ